jgi:2-polyprenyl-6-methoxyphenol hydroxylase-like FAD-dependent oxidoreductase
VHRVILLLVQVQELLHNSCAGRPVRFGSVELDVTGWFHLLPVRNEEPATATRTGPTIPKRTTPTTIYHLPSLYSQTSSPPPPSTARAHQLAPDHAHRLPPHHARRPWRVPRVLSVGNAAQEEG